MSYVQTIKHICVKMNDWFFTQGNSWSRKIFAIFFTTSHRFLFGDKNTDNYSFAHLGLFNVTLLLLLPLLMLLCCFFFLDSVPNLSSYFFCSLQNNFYIFIFCCRLFFLLIRFVVCCPTNVIFESQNIESAMYY